MNVLVTAGTVYGKLDDNKLVGNRIRGIWAVKFALRYLYGRLGRNVVLLLPDTFDKKLLEQELITAAPPLRALLHEGGTYAGVEFPRLEIRYHDGYHSYAEQCFELAKHVDAAVMAAAVVNWIPKKPFVGKMPTAGFQEGDEQLIPFILAPRVIDRMRKLNPAMKLIGCKMTANDRADPMGPLKTYEAAYQTLEKAKCHVVVANDLSDLKLKRLVYPDGSCFSHNLLVGDSGFYGELVKVLDDKHYRTEAEPNPKDPPWSEMESAVKRMERIIEKYRERFSQPTGQSTRVFGGIAVRVGESGFLVSPREKGRLWTANECVFVSRVDHEAGVTYTFRGNKPSLNAPLMVRMLETFKHKGDAVLHLHEMLYQTKAGKPGEPLGENQCPTEPYAPPSTFRDNQRPLPRHAFNIEGHGFVAVLNSNDVDVF